MANKNNTREGIHSGLSQSKSDEKWADMLNFRSSDNRTFVVPRKYKLYDKDTVFHTIVRGVGDLVYAFGDRFSGLFRGNESSGLGQLWRARVTRLVTNEDQSENLKIRGSYLGTELIELRLTVVNGKLVSDANWPAVIEEVVEEEQPSSLNCGVVTNFPQLDLTVLFLPSAPLWALRYTPYDFAEFVYTAPGPWSVHNGVSFTNPPLFYCKVPITSNIEADTSNTSYWQSVSPWGTTTYTVGRRVLTSNGNIYRCITAHSTPHKVPEDGYNSGGGFYSASPDAAVYWAFERAIGTPKLHVLGVNYAVNDKVKYLGLVYNCNTSHLPETANRPGVGSEWTLFTSTALPASGADVTFYQGRDLVQIYRTNAAGLLTVPLLPNPYRIQITRDDFELKEVTFLKTSDDQTTTITAQQV